jgi:hypothetical protein
VALSNAGGTLWPLVKALEPLPCTGSVADRNFIVRLLADRFGTTPQVEESAKAQQHILSIVEVCARRPDGLTTLLDIVAELDGGTIHLKEVKRIIEALTAPELWPEKEREELFALLRGMIFTDLVELYHQVAGVGAPELPTETSYGEVFLALETLNANPDGLPKPIVFVEYLANRRRPDLAIELRRWVDRQASRLGVITELQKMRRESRAPLPGPPPNSPAYLVLLLRRVGLSGKRFQLCHWSQLDLAEGWHPDRGDDFFGTIGEVKRQVATLIESVETKWARYQPDIRIEIVLPGDLLNLEVEQWPWEVDSPLPPVPIGCRYAFAIRSLERMQAGKWHRSWHTRWSVLTGQLEIGAIQPESSRQADKGDTIRKLVADFENNPNVVALMLSKPPDPTAEDGGEEVAVALRGGLPIIVWHREDCDSAEFLATVGELLHGDGPGTVLQRMRQLRTSAYESHTGHVGHHIALMWDDPERLVVPADLGPPRDPMEASVA